MVLLNCSKRTTAYPDQYKGIKTKAESVFSLNVHCDPTNTNKSFSNPLRMDSLPDDFGLTSS